MVKKKDDTSVKTGYNEKNPSEPQGAFPPASDQQGKKDKPQSNTADKKAKQDRS